MLLSSYSFDLSTVIKNMYISQYYKITLVYRGIVFILKLTFIELRRPGVEVLY